MPKSSKHNPKLSILIPIYNVERYLAKCLDSVVNQTLKDIEIICLNDGSTDSSLDILKEFAAKDPRIIIIDKPNSGYGDSMNRGLEKASGEYIGIVESDDYIDRDAFEKLYNLAKKHDADIVKSNFYRFTTPTTKNPPQSYIVSRIDEKVNTKPEKSPQTSEHLPEKSNNNPQKTLENTQKISEIPLDFPETPFSALDNSVVFQFAPAIWSAIYRRRFIEENDIKFLPTTGASYQDISFSLKVWLLARRIVLTPAAYLHYRVDNENSSINNPGKTFCVVDEYAEIDRFFSQQNDQKVNPEPIEASQHSPHNSSKNPKTLPETLKKSLAAAKFRNYHWNLQRLADPLAAEFYEVMVRELRAAKSAGLLRRSDFNLKHWLSVQLMTRHPALALRLFHLRSNHRTHKNNLP